MRGEEIPIHTMEPKIHPGEQIGIRLAHFALAGATQSSLSAFHNAGIGNAMTTRMSPSLQQIMDGAIQHSNTSMVIVAKERSVNSIVRRNFAYYVDGISNSLIDENLVGNDFWYKIGYKLKIIPKYKKKSNPIIFRFTLNYRKMAKDLVTLKYLVDNIFGGYVTYYSPDFIGIVDVHLVVDSQMVGLMGILEGQIGIDGISDSKMMENGKTFITIGSNLGKILTMFGVDNAETTSNNVYDVEKNLGIDAAREVLYDEILAKTENKNTAALISDFMTYSGNVSAFKKDNPAFKRRGFLSSIAFERPKNDIKAIAQGKSVDEVTSVYSQIITGNLPDVGSGSRLFSLQESFLNTMQPSGFDWADE